MESSDNDEPFLALDSMLEVSLVEGQTTTLECAVPNGNNQVPSQCNDAGLPERNIIVDGLARNVTTMCGCKKKCFEALGIDIISKADSEFLIFKTEVAKTAYLKNLITVPIELDETSTTQSILTKTQKPLYYIKANEEKYAVCRKAFLSIYNISPRRLKKLCLEIAVQNRYKQKFLPQALQWNMDEEEEIFYLDLFEDLPKIRNLRLHCTKCDVHLGCYEKSKLYKHLHLGVLLCQECFNFYSSGDFAVGDDGSEIFCRWCGEGGRVICCSNCPNVFCKNCINLNFSKNVMREIIASSEWLCFLCNFRSLWEHRAVCRAAITYAASDTEVKQELANISPRPGDDAKYCCSIDSFTSQQKPKHLRSSMPSHVTFAKFLNYEKSIINQKEKIPTSNVSAVTSTSANVTISECTSSENQFQEALQVTQNTCLKKNLSLGLPWPIHVSYENQKLLKPGSIYQIQTSNENTLSLFPGVHNSLITRPSVSVQSQDNTTSLVLNTNSAVPFMRLPLVRTQYAIITNTKPLYALQNQVPQQTSQNTVPHQNLQNSVPLQTLQNSCPLQTFQSPVPLHDLQSHDPLHSLQSSIPLQTLQDPSSCQKFQNQNRNHLAVIRQNTNSSVICCKPRNSATSAIVKKKQIPSKNHILPPVVVVDDDDDDCQIISTTGFNTNLEKTPADHIDSSASSIINKNNKSRIRVRTPAMLQSMVINESGTDKCTSSEPSEDSNNLITSPEQKSQLLKAVLSDHMYVRTEKNTGNCSFDNDTGTPLNFNVEQNNTEIMSNRIDSSTDTIENSAKSNSLGTNNNSPQPKSPCFKNCLPEITNLAKFMLSRALLLQEEINRMAYVDKSEFYFKNVPLFLENCKAGITKIEVNYIRERNKYIKNASEPKEIMLVHDDNVVSIQPLCAEENRQPICEKNDNIQIAIKKQINNKFSEIKNNTSTSNEDIRRNCVKRKLCDSDVVSNSKKQKVDSVSNVFVVLERLPKDFLKISESVNIKKVEEDKSKINNNSEYKKGISKHNCIRPCYVRLVRINEADISKNAK